MCEEHGIGPDGVLKSFVEGGVDRKDVFFYQVYFYLIALDDRQMMIIIFPVPFCLIWNLKSLKQFKNPNIESCSIQKICYSRLNYSYPSFIPKEGTGAGNNWGIGYSESDKCGEDLLDIITREAEDCDSFEVDIRKLDDL